MGDPDVDGPSAPVAPSDRIAEPIPPPPLATVKPTGRRHRRRIVFAAAVAALLGGGFVATQELSPGAVSVGATPSQSDPAGLWRTSPPRTDQQRLAVAQALLDHRANAIERRDPDAFGATIDPETVEFGDAQAAMFDSLSAVPYDRWTYTVEGIDPFQLPAARRREVGATVFTARVSVHYRLQGYDEADARSEAYLTFVQRGRSWYIASDADGAELGHRTQRQLWDFGKVTVVRGERSIVLGLGGQSAMQRYAAVADAAVPRVTGVWGEDWEQKVVVIAPDTREHMAALLDADEDRYSQIAAITRVESPPTEQAAADRIVINPALWPRLDSYGRRIVMTHEITHVATRTATGRGVPTWLSEGFADYVGYLGTGIAPDVAAPELFQAVREGGPPRALPGDEDFQSQDATIAQAYQKAWLACTLIVDEHGEDELVAFYRAAGSGSDSKQANLDKAFRDVLATTTGEFTGAWRSYVNELAK